MIHNLISLKSSGLFDILLILPLIISIYRVPMKSPLYSQGLPLVMPIISDFHSCGFRVKTLTESEGSLPAEATVTCDPFPPPQTTIDC